MCIIPCLETPVELTRQVSCCLFFYYFCRKKGSRDDVWFLRRSIIIISLDLNTTPSSSLDRSHFLKAVFQAKRVEREISCDRKLKSSMSNCSPSFSLNERRQTIHDRINGLSNRGNQREQSLVVEMKHRLSTQQPYYEHYAFYNPILFKKNTFGSLLPKSVVQFKTMRCLQQFQWQQVWLMLPGQSEN